MFAALVSPGIAGAGAFPLGSCGFGDCPTGTNGHCTTGSSPRTGKCILGTD